MGVHHSPSANVVVGNNDEGIGIVVTPTPLPLAFVVAGTTVGVSSEGNSGATVGAGSGNS